MTHLRNKVKDLLENKGLYKAPVDVVKLAESFGLTILQQEVEYDGAILSKKEGFTIDGNTYNKAIIININQIPTRKRFTIAHEIAHWLIAPEKVREDLFAHRDDNLTHVNSEPEVNDLAAEILMPYGLVKEALKKTTFNYGITPSVIYDIANAFNVSYSAAEVRITKYMRGV